MRVYARHPDYLEEVGPPDPHRLSQRQALLLLQQANASLLYAMRTDDRLVKIGCSSNLAQRHYEFGFKFLAIQVGTFEDEAALHQRLRSQVARGQEFYHPTPEVLRIVNEMRASIGQKSLTSLL